ncbi:hypothetical protein KIN20_012738 [Parelaphostrongylus tenuis]|uniref:Uncharacterized protein n=1 Tax=Parelaphostrongylus tenuis TaxID=148309 RepID=A0AAD5QQM3_PARTN|nr:hypothetical protein KIN20_012738 [Parelaphostrongylus tenuis]
MDDNREEARRMEDVLGSVQFLKTDRPSIQWFPSSSLISVHFYCTKWKKAVKFSQKHGVLQAKRRCTGRHQMWLHLCK